MRGLRLSFRTLRGGSWDDVGRGVTGILDASPFLGIGVEREGEVDAAWGVADFWVPL